MRLGFYFKMQLRFTTTVDTIFFPTECNSYNKMGSCYIYQKMRHSTEYNLDTVECLRQLI